MNVEEIREYCLNKPEVTESFPFDETTLVFKVNKKMFVLVSLDDQLSINLKCDPDYAIELREKYSSVLPGYHMNKKLWNTIIIDGSLMDKEICHWIDNSYQLVIQKMPKKDRLRLLGE